MNFRKISIGDYIFNTVNYILLIFAAIISLYPFLYVVFASFSDPSLFVKHTGVMISPQGFSLNAYKAVLSNNDVYIGYLNTIFYVVVGTLLSTALTVVMAYPLSHPRLKYRKALMKIVVVTLFFSAGMIPSYIIVRNLGMLDSRLSIIIPGLLSTYNVIIMNTSFSSVPSSLEESARIDGANDLRIFWSIILPNVKATVAVIVMYYAVEKWNSWFSALLYITDRSKYPLQLFLREILIESSSQKMGNYSISSETAFLEEIIKHATTVVATVPILVAYPFVQKYFIKGTMIGAVKE